MPVARHRVMLAGIQEAEERRWQIWRQPKLHSKTFSYPASHLHGPVLISILRKLKEIHFWNSVITNIENKTASPGISDLLFSGTLDCQQHKIFQIVHSSIHLSPSMAVGSTWIRGQPGVYKVSSRPNSSTVRHCLKTTEALTVSTLYIQSLQWSEEQILWTTATRAFSPWGTSPAQL